MTAIYAHRGARRAAPENTEAAFQLAVEMGADGVELDVRLTCDGAAIVHHDPHLADGRLLHDLRVRELPQSVPALHDALDSCAGVRVNIELKNSVDDPAYDSTFAVVHRVIEELDHRTDDPGRWLVSSFDLGTLNEFHRLRPEVPTAFLTMTDPELGLSSTVEHGHLAWHPWWGDLSADLIQSAHQLGVVVNAWTCNEPDEIQRLINWSIDGVITDVPDIALAIRDRSR